MKKLHEKLIEQVRANEELVKSFSKGDLVCYTNRNGKKIFGTVRLSHFGYRHKPRIIATINDSGKTGDWDARKVQLVKRANL